MTRALNRNVLAGGGALLALLLTSALVGYQNTKNLSEDAGWVAHTYAVLDMTAGVLRRNVPAWLTASPVAGRILTIVPAHLRHGGDGAFYVILRRDRRGA